MIAPGAILIRADALRPPCFQLNEDPCPDGWRSVTLHPTHRERETGLAAVGWSLFYIAFAIRRTAFGSSPENRLHAALRRVMTDVHRLNCNSLEIDEVSTRSFLGLPYVSVSAHPRHLQKGMVFSGG